MRLALSSEKALIIADKDTHFVTVNAMNTRVGDGRYFFGDEENIEFWEIFGLDAETHEQIGEDAGKIEK